MDGFLWGEWPKALAYYWKGTLPTIDPEDIMPVSGTPVQGQGRVGPRPRVLARQPLAQFDAAHDGALRNIAEQAS